MCGAQLDLFEVSRLSAPPAQGWVKLPQFSVSHCWRASGPGKPKPVTPKKLSPKPTTQTTSASVFPAEYQIHVERPGYLFHLETTVEEVYLAARESVQRRLEQA